MSQRDKDHVAATLKPIVSGPEALTLPDKPGWACEEVGTMGRVYIIKYHGIEVALFIKRQLTELKLQPGDRFPEHVLQDPIDAWQRLDILGPSAQKANLMVSTTMKSQASEMQNLNMRIQAADTLNDRLETELLHKEESRATIAKQLKKQAAEFQLTLKKMKKRRRR